MKYGWVIPVVAALLALAFFSQAEALSADEGQRMARSVGCDAKVYSLPSSQQFNGFYAEDMYEGPVIVFVGFENLSEPWQRFIAWHEIGHCVQRKYENWSALVASGPQEVEWGADAFAIKMLANEGIDGALLNEEMWTTLYNQYAFEGYRDGPHGLSTWRITRGNLNRIISKHEGA